MARFVIGGLFFLVLRQNHRAAFGTHHHLIFGGFKILHGDKTTTDTGSHQRGLIHKVREIRTRETRRTARNDAQVDVWAQRRLACVNAKDFFAAFDVRIADSHIPVKTARTQQRWVQHVFTVGRGQNDYAFVGLKTVHLDKQLV